MKAAFLVIVLVALLVPLYAGAYWAMLDHKAAVMTMGCGEGVTVYSQPIEQYRFGGAKAAAFLWPAHKIDRWIRPGRWKLSETKVF
jgi:hypothetical protein